MCIKVMRHVSVWTRFDGTQTIISVFAFYMRFYPNPTRLIL